VFVSLLVFLFVFVFFFSKIIIPKEKEMREGAKKIQRERERKKFEMHRTIEAKIHINISAMNMARFRGQRLFVHGYNRIQAEDLKIKQNSNISNGSAFIIYMQISQNKCRFQ